MDEGGEGDSGGGSGGSLTGHLQESRRKEASEHAEVVKGLHAHLREQVNSGCASNDVWRELLGDSATLQAYSQAMHSLATQHWAVPATLGVGGGGGGEDGHGCSRISWTVEACEDYYGKDRAMHRHLLKDLRRMAHGTPTLVAPSLLPSTEEAVLELVDEMATGSRTLLDVGSCFNPFSSFKCFDVTAIDIAPAHESVHRCDFLSVPVCDVDYDLSSTDSAYTSSTISFSSTSSSQTSSTISTSSHTSFSSSQTSSTISSTQTSSSNPFSSSQTSSSNSSQTSSSKSSSMPFVLRSESYHVVVFSLFLSYLPVPMQRMESCVKAHRVLRPHGLLLIVTPDSSHQNKRAGMMKSWKNSIEAIGFHRCNYVKDTHLHCMAFRKTTAAPQNCSDMKDSLLYGLYIPQDRPQKDATSSSSSPPLLPCPASHCSDISISNSELSSQLPFFDCVN